MYVDGLDFAYHIRPQDCYFWFCEKFQHVRFDGIAGALQKYVEEILCQWVSNWIQQTGVGTVRFGGGVAMNIKAMMEIGKLDGVVDLQILPTSADDSLPLSVCYYALHTRNSYLPASMFSKNAFIGPEYPAAEENLVVEKAKQLPGYELRKATAEIAAKLLLEGKVLGRCVGNLEFGARALGSRSILVHPAYPNVIRIINHKIK